MVATEVPLTQRAAPAEPQSVVPLAEPSTARLTPAREPQTRLYAADGSIRGLDTQVRLLDERASARARFDYEIPGVAAAETAFSRPLAIDPQTTRFDRYWQAPPDLLTDALERAVKASTLVVSVPVPGMPGYRVGCAVVVIAAAGSCGMTEPKRAVYDIDDPNTLTAEEARACETIWERLSVAATQTEHRRLRRIYDLGCRLPLATGPAVEYR